MSTIDVPQTSSLLKYIEKKDFKMAYKLACLGITDQDFRLLGLEALQSGDFEIAKKVHNIFIYSNSLFSLVFHQDKRIAIH